MVFRGPQPEGENPRACLPSGVSPSSGRMVSPAFACSLLLRSADEGAAPYGLLAAYVVVVADYAVLQVGAAAHARTGEQDAAFDSGVRPDPAVATDYHVPEELHAPPDDRVFSYQNVALYLCSRVYLGVLPDPQSLAPLLARDLDPDLA